MANYVDIGGVPISGFISPGTTSDTFPVIDTTLGIDGLRNYSGGTEIFSGTTITELRRRAGMIVGIESGSRYFKLKDKDPWDFDETDWEEVNFGGGSGSAITGGTFSAGTLTLVNGSGDTITITGFTSGGDSYWISGSTGIGSIKTISGGNISQGDYSISQGFNNSVVVSPLSTTIGGSGNTVTKTYLSSIIGGLDDEIIASSGTTIIGGATNQIAAGSDNGIFQGQNNLFNSSYNSLIFGGDDNSITSDTYYGTLINSIESDIVESLSSQILGGDGNIISDGNHSFIIGGTGLTITNGQFSTIINGLENQLIGAGGNNIVYESSIIGGSNNVMSSAQIGSSIIGGSGNTINGYYSGSLFGKYNSIIGGVNNQIGIGTERNGIIGGTDNRINGEGGISNGVIAGGDNNFIAEAMNNKNSFIGGGTNNSILYDSSVPLISPNSAIIGGSGNTIATLGEEIEGNTVILGGYNITATTANTVYVPKLNIRDVVSGTSIYNLGIDSNGFVVTGTTNNGGGSGTTISAYTYDSTNNTFSIEISGSSSFDASFNTVSGLTVTNDLTVNNELEVNGFAYVNGHSIFSGETDTYLFGPVLQIAGTGDTEPIFAVEGSVGELFTVTDTLTGELFGVNNVSGLPILEVYDDNTIMMGNHLAPSLNTTVIINQNVGQSILYSIPTTAYTGGFFEYTVKNTSGVRAGSIMSVFSGSSIDFNETTTNDIGDTTDVTFDMNISGTSANLLVSATSNGWEIKTIVRSI